MIVQKQVRIFLKNTTRWNNARWAESFFGDVLIPLTQSHSFEWFWFTRYQSPINYDNGDCDASLLSQECVFDDKTYKSIRFRFSMKESDLPNFKKHLNVLCANYDCEYTDIRSFNRQNDIGYERFTEPFQKEEYSFALTQSLFGFSKVILMSIKKDDDGAWTFKNDDIYGDKMVSPHHLICNMSGIFYDSVMFRNSSKLKFKSEKWVKILNKIPKRFFNKVVYFFVKKQFN